MPTDRKVFMAVALALLSVTVSAKVISSRTQVGGNPHGMRAVCQKCANPHGGSLRGHSPEGRRRRRRCSGLPQLAIFGCSTKSQSHLHQPTRIADSALATCTNTADFDPEAPLLRVAGGA